MRLQLHNIQYIQIGIIRILEVHSSSCLFAFCRNRGGHIIHPRAHPPNYITQGFKLNSVFYFTSHYIHTSMAAEAHRMLRSYTQGRSLVASTLISLLLLATSILGESRPISTEIICADIST